MPDFLNGKLSKGVDRFPLTSPARMTFFSLHTVSYFLNGKIAANNGTGAGNGIYPEWNFITKNN